MKAELVQIPENNIQETENSEEDDDIANLDNQESLWGEWENSNPSPSTNYPPRQPANNASNSSLSNFSAPPTTTSRRRGTSKLLAILAVIGVGSIAAGVGLNWWWQNQQISRLSDIPGIPNQSQTAQPNNFQIDLKTATNEIVTTSATEKLSRGDLQGGLAAVEELLNRNALPSAKAALDLVPKKQIDDPAVNFYKGRLAWQSVQTGDKRFSIDDARRYWESAVKKQPESFLYTNALGFAYYAEGNLNRANDSWFKAVNVAVKQQKTTATPVSTNTPVPKEALSAYAGLALGLYKDAARQPAGKREQYLNEAIKLRQMVVKDDPQNFQMEQLSKNWLWNEKALADWKSLLGQQPSSAKGDR